jgi:hypothetical protein
LKEINGGIRGPAPKKIPYEMTAEDAYFFIIMKKSEDNV